MTPKPTSYPSHYDYHLLDLAANIFEATQRFVLNPRNTEINSLFLADMDWVNDLNIHMAMKQHAVDMLKKTKGDG